MEMHGINNGGGTPTLRRNLGGLVLFRAIVQSLLDTSKNPILLTAERGF